MAINTDILLSTDVGAAVSGGSTSLDTRHLYAFTDAVAELNPQKNPFFAYLVRAGKQPTDDPEFKMLENRTKIDWTGRNFYLAATTSLASAAVGDLISFTVDNGAAVSVDWLLKGMTFNIGFIDSSNSNPEPVQVRIETDPVDAGTTTTFTGYLVADPTSSMTDHSSNNNTECQVTGSSFAEATGSPDVWSRELDSTFGYTQIFKTAAEWSGTALATRYRGYANERERVWAEKLMEQAVDIERTCLLNTRASQDSKRYSWGIIGAILANQNLATGTTAFSYGSATSYVRQIAYTSASYDVFLGDLEVISDPARGGDIPRLALAGLPVVTYLNKLGDGQFLDTSVGYGNSPIRLGVDFNSTTGVFGHKILNIETINGDLHLVRAPLLRGIAKNYLVAVDMGNVAYRPLVANGYNRDTHIITNVQAKDEDLRKDMILTEAGLHVGLFERHVLWSFH